MTTVSAHDATETREDEIHEGSWSKNLELPEYADDPAIAIADSIDAIERTKAGTHVNLVTHASLGHPSTFLPEPLLDRFGKSVELEYIDQCGCGGHVTRIHVGTRD